MPLKAIKPHECTPGKAKIVIFGREGVGKTWWALQFPDVYYIDSEGGAELSHYQKRLAEANGAYFGVTEGSRDMDAVIGEVKALATEKHKYKTLVIDSWSKLYNTACGEAEEKAGSEYGRDKKAANVYVRRLLRWIERLDMNVIFICHEAKEWGVDEVIGYKHDGYDKLAYELHASIRVIMEDHKRKGFVQKSRLPGFKDGTRFDWDFDVFANAFGRDAIYGDVSAIALLDDAQKDRIIKLMAATRTDTTKFLNHYKCDAVDDLSDKQAADAIGKLEHKLNS